VVVIASIVGLRINQAYGRYIGARGDGVYPIWFGRERSIRLASDAAAGDPHDVQC